jgi:hypothetical protein
LEEKQHEKGTTDSEGEFTELKKLFIMISLQEQQEEASFISEGSKARKGEPQRGRPKPVDASDYYFESEDDNCKA